MTIRRDYTNGQGYICPTENTAVHNLDKPSERPVAVKSLHEQDLKRLDRPTPMQRLAQIAEQEDRPGTTRTIKQRCWKSDRRKYEY